MPDLFLPFTHLVSAGLIGGLDLGNRIVVSPMRMYSAVDGVSGGWAKGRTWIATIAPCLLSEKLVHCHRNSVTVILRLCMA